MKDTLVIIPAYNEEDNIARVLQDIRSLEEDFDILVVNDGSSDNTEEIVKQAGVELVTHVFNLGYGGAIQTGFKYAVTEGYNYIIQFDADGQHSPKDLITIHDALLRSDADIVIGSRFKGKSTMKVGMLKMTAICMFRWIIKALSGAVITDPTSGLKGLSRRVFEYYSHIGNYPADFPDADILIQSVRCRFKIKEVPANMSERTAGESMHSGLKPLYYLVKVMLSIFVVVLRDKFGEKGFKMNG